MVIKKDRKKDGISLFGITLSEQLCCILVILTVFGAYMFSGDIFSSGVELDTTTTTSHTTTTKTNTGTTTTTTTTTTTNVILWSFKVMWIYQPKMQIDPPDWVLVEVYFDDALGDYCDGTYLFGQNSWYVADYGYHFQSGVNYRITISDSSGFEFELEGEPYITIHPDYVSYQWDLISSGDDWGDLYFEWTLV